MCVCEHLDFLPPKIALLSAGGLVLSLKTIKKQKKERASPVVRNYAPMWFVAPTPPVSTVLSLRQKRKGCPFYIPSGQRQFIIMFTSHDGASSTLGLFIRYAVLEDTHPSSRAKSSAVKGRGVVPYIVYVPLINMCITPRSCRSGLHGFQKVKGTESVQ